jgi:hypothetical protein
MHAFRLEAAALFCVVGALFGATVNAQAPAPLPQGNNGIAAAYPNDVGITSHPEVLFADGFEDYSSPAQLVSSGRYSNYYQSANIAFDTSTYFRGSKALRLRMPQAGYEISNAIVKTISPKQDRLFLRVYARYQPGYAGMNSAHNGLRITGNYTGPGRRPNGRDFFLVNIEESRYRNEGEPGYTNAYVYHPEQDDVYGEHWYPDGSTGNGRQSFGQYFVARPLVVPPRGEWICYEMMVQLNTPGSRDGRIAVWQDGKLIADWQNVRFRDTSTVKIDEIQLENGGQGSTRQNDKWYDNLVVATSYIGPIGSGSGAQPQAVPNPPTNLKAE